MAENILHFGAVRFRLNGNGNLNLELHSLDDTNVDTLLAIPITNTGVEPTRLSNFNSQRARVKGFTTVINEHFKINRIIIYVKPIYTSYPQLT